MDLTNIDNTIKEKIDIVKKNMLTFKIIIVSIIVLAILAVSYQSRSFYKDIEKLNQEKEKILIDVSKYQGQIETIEKQMKSLEDKQKALDNLLKNAKTNKKNNVEKIKVLDNKNSTIQDSFNSLKDAW